MSNELEHMKHVNKNDRNTHEFSADESIRAESIDVQKRGGGYRSGSRGAGTSDRPDPRPSGGHSGPRADAAGWPEAIL